MINLQQIRLKSESVLTSRAVPIHPHLPLLDIPQFRGAEDIGERVVALYAMAGLANGADRAMLQDWLRSECAWKFLSAAEQEILEADRLDRRLMNELSWKQESLLVLSWCGNLIDELPWPDTEADLRSIFGSIPPEIPVQDFIRSSCTRKLDDIVQQLDIYYCLHAALNHPEIWKGAEWRQRPKIEIVLERRQALEWVCNRSVDWDEIYLDT